jgi:hypothetical protein
VIPVSVISTNPIKIDGIPVGWFSESVPTPLMLVRRSTVDLARVASALCPGR